MLSFYTVVVFIFFTFLGCFWNRNDWANAGIKCLLFLVAFGAVYTGVRCDFLPMVFVAVVGLMSLVGAILWKGTGAFNVTLKCLFGSLGILSGILLVFGY